MRKLNFHLYGVPVYAKYLSFRFTQPTPLFVVAFPDRLSRRRLITLCQKLVELRDHGANVSFFSRHARYSFSLLSLILSRIHRQGSAEVCVLICGSGSASDFEDNGFHTSKLPPVDKQMLRQWISCRLKDLVLETEVMVVSSTLPGMGKTRVIMEHIEKKNCGKFNNRIICHPRDSIYSFVDTLFFELSSPRNKIFPNFHFDFTGVVSAPMGPVISCFFSSQPPP